MRGMFLIALAAMLWGTTGTSQALAPASATPIVVGTMRLVFGGATLLLFAQLRGDLRQWRQMLRPELLWASVSVAAYQVCFFAAVKLTGVTVGTMVGLGSAPILAGLFAYLVRGEKLTQRWAIATILAVIGCVILLSSGSDTMIVDGRGVLLALGAGLSYTIFTLAHKALSEQITGDGAMALSFVIGAIILLPTLPFYETSWIATGRGLLVLLHLGVLATGVSYLLFGRGLKTVPVATVGTLTLVEPLTAGLLGLLLLGERLTLFAGVGISLLFVGLVVLITGKRQPKIFGDV